MRNGMVVARRACRVALLVALAAMGCAVGYRPMQLDLLGYTSTKIGSDRYAVSFVGNAENSREFVGKACLRRCAEIARDVGPGRFDVEFDGDELLLAARIRELHPGLRYNARLEREGLEKLLTTRRRAYTAVVRIHDGGARVAARILASELEE